MAELRRSIGPVALTLYGLGTVLGAGIYVLIGEVAAEAGVWAPVSFALAAGVAALTGLSFGELAARIPESAGEAAYVEAGFRTPRLASIVGLVVALTGVVSAAAISVGFAGYFQIFFPGVPQGVAVAGLVVVLGAIAAVGVEASVAAAGLMTVLEVAGLFLVLWSARSAVNAEAWGQAAAAPVETSGVFVGAFLAFYAFIGFEDMVNSAEEVIEPERSMPRAILGALLIATVLYIAVALVCVLSLPVSELASAKAPLALVYERATGQDPWVIAAISLIAVSNGALVQIIMGGRVLYGLARKGWIPGFLASVHPRTQTPIVATGVIVAIVLALALAFPLRTLAQVTSFAILAVFALVNAALVQLKRRGEVGPSVNLPMAVPALGVVASLGLIGLRLWSLLPQPAPPPEPVPEPQPAPTMEVQPAWNPDACGEPMMLDWSPLGEGRGGLKHAKAPIPDLDGDNRIEVFIVKQDAGTGFATVKATLELTASDPIELDHTWSYNEMVHVIDVPEALQGPDKAAWRAPFEAELLRIRCPTPDPLLEWLLQSPVQPTWYAGRPILPSLYGVYSPEDEQWTVVSAHTHTMDPPPVGTWPVKDEERGDLEVLRTQHGVVLYDRAARAHRWVYASRRGTGKLRHPTVALSGFEGDGVIVARNGAPGEPAPPVIVDLASGKVVEERSQSEGDPR